jgi:hypothetical protein
VGESSTINIFAIYSNLLSDSLYARPKIRGLDSIVTTSK